MIAAEADGLGRVLPGGAPAKEPAEAGAIGEAAVLVPAADAPAAILAVEAEPEAAVSYVDRPSPVHRAEGKTKGRDGVSVGFH